MRVLLTMMAIALLYSCNGVKQSASVESGNQSSTSETGLSYTLSTITANDTVLDNGDAMIVTVNLVDVNGVPYISTVPLQVMFYSTGGTSRGTFSGSWDNGNGSYSAIFSGTVTGTATKIRALVNMRDIVTTYPTVTVQSAELAWNPAGYEFNYVPITTASPIIDFVLSNSGNKAASSCGAPVISDTTNFAIVGDTCGTANLNPGSSCTVQVQSTPMTLGLKQATLSRTCTNTGTVSTFSQRIRVTGVNPVNMAWAPLTNNFGTVGVGNQSAAQTFTFTNTGVGNTIGCEIPVVSDPANFKITSDTCNRTSQVSGASCNVTVVAKPSTVGAMAATLSRTCTLGGTVSTTSNGLTYTAVLPVSLVWSPLTKAFADTVEGQKSASSVFTLTNTKTGTATGCSAPVLSNSTDFQITIDECGTSDLGPGASCKVYVQAKPQSAGSLSTTLSRTCSFDGTYSTTASGITVTAPAAVIELAWLRDSIPLGEVSPGIESNVISMAIVNKGTLSATGCTAPVLSDTLNFNIVEDNCGTADLDGYGMCTIKVKGTPGAGPFTATLTRTCTAGGTIVATLNATGSTNSPVSIAQGAGTDFTCILMDDGALKCWGGSSSGQLGNGGTDGVSVPKSNAVTTVLPPDPVTKLPTVGAGVSHACAALTSGRVSCWGLNTSGQLGNGTTTNSASPVTVLKDATTDLMDIVSVTTGENHSCALNNAREVYCWGHNGYGQLGTGTASNSQFAVKVNTTVMFDSISAGNNHTCGRSGGSVYCWGKNGNGQVGDKTKVDKSVPTITDGTVIAPGDAVSVAAGGDSTCLIRASGNLGCWGKNDQGQLGDSTVVDKLYPVPIPLAQTVSMVAPGNNHTCVVSTTNIVKCWGQNDFNQLGNDSYTNSSVPQAVPNSTNAVQVATGANHTCAGFNDGSIKCWGDNSQTYVLGDGNIDLTKIPYQFTTLSNVVDVAQGSGFICAVDQGGSVFCWGKNNAGQLGDGSTTGRSTPGPVTGITTAVQVEAGVDSACAVLADSSVQCWGNNTYSTYGDGTTTSSKIPVATGLTGVTSLKMGVNGACALMSGGTVKCWGMNQGDVGNNTVTQVKSPATVLGIANATAIAKGVGHSCALLSDKTVKCWGQNSLGQLGLGNLTNTRQPTNVVSGLTNVEKISARVSTTCAILTDKTVKCWGNNDNGQIGDGTIVNRTTPVSVALADIAEISAGSSLTCASNVSGKMFCFGAFLGNSAKTPVPAYGMSDVAVPSSVTDPCAITNAGDLYCWGKNYPDIHGAKTVNGF